MHAPDLNPSYSVVIRLLPEGCRTVGPINDGIAFPVRNVKLRPNASTVYRVSGSPTWGGVLYTVCADNQSFSDQARDQAIFTAGYYYSTDPNAPGTDGNTVRHFLYGGTEDAERGFNAYIEHFKKQAWGEIFIGTVAFVDLALTAYTIHTTFTTLATDPNTARPLVDVAFDEVKSKFPGKTLQLSQAALGSVAKQPDEVVKGLAWTACKQHTLRGQFGY